MATSSEAKGHVIPSRTRPGAIRFIDKWQRRAEDTITSIGGILIVAIVTISVAEVIGRYTGTQTVPGKIEIEDVLMGALVFCGFATTQRMRRHIRMDTLIDRFFKGRVYWTIEFFTTLLALAAYTVVAVYSIKSTIFAYQLGDATGYLWWPTWPFKMFLPIGSVLLCLRFISQLFRYTTRAISNDQSRDMVEGGEWV